jgi:peptidoglycan/LPS O-acetylase OafA/YrhL
MLVDESVNLVDAPMPPETATRPTPADSSEGLRLRGHLPALDGLRGLAILFVLLGHVTPQGGHTFIGAIFRGLSGTAGAGVSLFFVLSGFLITGILLDAKGAPHYFRNFYARRTLRIFPLYYGVLVACFLVVPLLHPFGPAEQNVAHEQGWLWFYAANIRESFPHTAYPFTGGWISMDHFWSLAVEEHFYLAWPLAVYLLSRRAMIGLSIGLIVGAMALRLGLYLSPLESMAHYHFTLCRMDELAMGGLLALMARGAGGAAWVGKAAIVALPAGLIATAATWRSEFCECVFRGSLLGITFAGLLVSVVTGKPRSPVKMAFNNGPMRFLGKYSYATYVLHPLILSTVMKSPLSHQRFVAMTHSGIVGVFAYMTIALALSLGAAWLSWHLFEKHFLKLKRFFEYRSKAAAA